MAESTSPVKKEQFVIDPEELALRKRLPSKGHTFRPNDIYVGTHTQHKEQLIRCQKLIENGESFNIHGLGSATTIAANLALQAQNHFPTVNLQTTTSTVYIHEKNQRGPSQPTPAIHLHFTQIKSVENEGASNSQS